MEGKIIQTDDQYQAFDSSGQLIAHSPTLNKLKLNLTSMAKDASPTKSGYIQFFEDGSFRDGEMGDMYDDRRFHWDFANSWLYQTGG